MLIQSFNGKQLISSIYKLQCHNKLFDLNTVWKQQVNKIHWRKLKYGTIIFLKS